jgi:hypothetical protein
MFMFPHSEGLSSEVVRSAVDAASQGDVASLDVKSLLGEALSTLTEQLGIDLTAEIAGSDKTQADIQVKEDAQHSMDWTVEST